jgi:hypothetical protein
MTLSNLSRVLDKYESQLGYNYSQLESLRGLPFYDWNKPNVTNDFNHVIGLPKKNGKEYPLFDYELSLFNALNEHKHVWVKKATGLGITEFILRYMAWLCFSSNTEVKNSQMCIVTAPRIELAITLIDRMKGLFHELGVTFDSKETTIELNGVHIEAYPSHHLDTMRGLKDVSFIFQDESDFYPIGQQQDARDVSERYIAKSNPWIVMVSTPNAPNNLFEKIENEPAATCLYHRMFLDYTYGLDKIYSHDDIAKARASPSFEREYNLKYLGNIGNLIPYQDVDAAIEEYDLSPAADSVFTSWIGIDPAFSSSQFGICIVQWRDDKLNVVYTELLDKPLYTNALNLVRQLIQTYAPCKVFIDGSAAHLIHELKHGYGEYIPYEKLKPDRLKSYISSACREPLIVPVNFQLMHKEMAKHIVKGLAKQRVRIHPKFDKLITSLKSATTKDDEYSIDKSKSAFDDLFDSFRMALLCLKAEGE